MLLLDETLAKGLPIMFDLLGVPDPERPSPPLDPEVRQRQFLDLMRRIGRARSAREPAVHLFEDLHWFDGASEEFIAHLVEVAATATPRPAIHACRIWPCWRTNPQTCWRPLALVTSSLSVSLNSQPAGDQMATNLFLSYRTSPETLAEVARPTGFEPVTLRSVV
jgi:predicted ATPase